MLSWNRTKVEGLRPVRATGRAAMELTGGSIFLVVLLVTIFDVSLIMFGVQVNDRACREACQAAARQTTSEKAMAAARETLALQKLNNQFVENPTLLFDPVNFLYQDGNATVTVTSQCKVKLPVPLICFGAEAEGGITFRKRYTLPIESRPIESRQSPEK